MAQFSTMSTIICDTYMPNYQRSHTENVDTNIDAVDCTRIFDIDEEINALISKTNDILNNIKITQLGDNKLNNYQKVLKHAGSAADHILQQINTANSRNTKFALKYFDLNSDLAIRELEEYSKHSNCIISDTLKTLYIKLNDCHVNYIKHSNKTYDEVIHAHHIQYEHIKKKINDIKMKSYRGLYAKHNNTMDMIEMNEQTIISRVKDMIHERQLYDFVNREHHEIEKKAMNAYCDSYLQYIEKLNKEDLLASAKIKDLQKQKYNYIANEAINMESNYLEMYNNIENRFITSLNELYDQRLNFEKKMIQLGDREKCLDLLHAQYEVLDTELYKAENKYEMTFPPSCDALDRLKLGTSIATLFKDTFASASDDTNEVIMDGSTDSNGHATSESRMIHLYELLLDLLSPCVMEDEALKGNTETEVGVTEQNSDDSSMNEDD